MDEEYLNKIILSKIQNEINEGNLWKAVFMIHSILTDKLADILQYSHVKRKKGKLLNRNHSLKQSIARRDLESFYKLVRICFLCNIITKNLMNELLNFNEFRNNIAHKIYNRDKYAFNEGNIDNELKNHVMNGIRLIKKYTK